MRQYWIPALKSDELPAPDCPPIRLRLLNENLIAFRATSGAVGIIANSCPHRGASLFFGRNEEEGLRCVYHGWKFDVDGNCVDMPSEPAESNFKSKVKATTYPCQERNGVIWTYMGTRETPPSLPDLEPNMMGDGQYTVSKVHRDCNWIQALEGDIDTSHLAFLHLGSVRMEDSRPGSMDYYVVKDRAPRYVVVETEFGTSYGAYREAESDMMYWRLAHYLFPFYTMIPTGVLGLQILVRAWVPMDDENMMFWSMSVPRSRQFGQGGGQGNAAATGDGRPANAATNGGGRPANAAANNRGGGGMEFIPSTSDWMGKFRLTQNRENDYLIDREAQSNNVSFTGIAGIHQQDQAITESMGPIYHRDREHLGTSDSMVIRTRRRIINAAKALRDEGILPPGVDTPEVYRYRSGGVFLLKGVDWLDGTNELRRAFRDYKPEELVTTLAVGS
jgi:phenylpropionate dioxygenase-like ring-hydroxylating dioxygenase large terminal subunit